MLVTAAAVVAKSLIPDTGQILSYTNTFGEDHDYTINPPSYTVSANGTVTDNVTGLVWQQDDNTSRNLGGATTYCNDLALAGYFDWRLPSVGELLGVVDYGRSFPAINQMVFPGVKMDWYWTSTTRVESTGTVWGVDFNRGFVVPLVSTEILPARCTRGGK